MAEDGARPDVAQVQEMFVVQYWDKHDRAEVVAATQELAQEYVDGQWSKEFYSVTPITVVTALPEPRPLYILSVRVHADPAKPEQPQVDDWQEFPGLGNGENIPLGEVVSSMKEYAPYGWDVTATGWDLEQTRAVYEERLAEARAARTARLEAFAGFPVNTVVRADSGRGPVMTRTVHGGSGALSWAVVGGGYMHDAEVDPSTLTVLAEGGETDE